VVLYFWNPISVATETRFYLCLRGSVAKSGHPIQIQFKLNACIDRAAEAKMPHVTKIPGDCAASLICFNL